MNRRNMVTLRWLKRQGACSEGLDFFIKKWGKAGKPTAQKVVWACHGADEPYWAEWVLQRKLPLCRTRENWEDERLDAYWVARKKCLLDFPANRHMIGMAAERDVDYKYARMLGE